MGARQHGPQEFPPADPDVPHLSIDVLILAESPGYCIGYYDFRRSAWRFEGYINPLAWWYLPSYKNDDATKEG